MNFFNSHVNFLATRLYVIVHSQWKNKMQGICGNFDSDSSNDLM